MNRIEEKIILPVLSLPILFIPVNFSVKNGNAFKNFINRRRRRVRSGGALSGNYFAASKLISVVSVSDILDKYFGFVSDRFSSHFADRQIRRRRQFSLGNDDRFSRRVYDLFDL